MDVDYIHYRLPYSEMALLGNLPTFFKFWNNSASSQKKSLANFTSKKKRAKDGKNLKKNLKCFHLDHFV